MATAPQASIATKPNAPNFAGILDKAPTVVEKPKPLPQGTYLFVVKGLPRYDKSSKKQTPFVEFILQPMQAMDDVDPDALNEWTTKPEGGTRNLNDAQVKATFYTTEDAIWRLDEFHENCGLTLEEGVSRRQRNEQVAGCQIYGTMKHEANEDGTSVFAKLAGTAKSE